MKEPALPILNNVQDETSEAWIRLCEYIDWIAESGAEDFSPATVLGAKLYAKIFTLPTSIAKLKKVKKVWLYGSSLERVPPEIGEMESLENFDVYTSYDLNWFPYEITRCKQLKNSRVSTRALLGNDKNRMSFPDLTANPVRYKNDALKCSICRKKITPHQTEQYWITLRVGTDDLPLLANICSPQCKDNLPNPEKGYLPFAHKGGEELKQPGAEEEGWDQHWQEDDNVD